MDGRKPCRLFTFGKLPSGRSLLFDPATEVFADDRRQRGDMGWGVVQARNVRELFAASMLESLTDFAIDFFEGFYAVSRKRRGHHRDAFDTRFG